MRELLKKYFVKAWPVISKVMPNCNFFKKLHEEVAMYELKREDPSRWRVEVARKKGAMIGENCRFFSLNFFSEPYLIEIGNNVIISGKVILVTHDGGIYLLKDEIPDIVGYYGKIKIGNNCFIGMGAIILPNVEIGNNCIVGAGAVVSNSVPDNSVVMGNPAKVVFKTSIYKKMRKNSPFVVKNKEYSFPLHIPKSVEDKLVVDHFKNFPPKLFQNKMTNKS